MKKRVVVLAALLATLLIGGTIGAFAWWDRLESSQNETLNIGKGVQIVVNVNTGSEDFQGQQLVPQDAIKKPGDVTEFELEYTVNLDSQTVEDLKLNVAVNNLKIGGDDTYANLVNVTVLYADGEGWTELGGNNYPVINAEKNAQVKVVISLNTISNETEYNAVNGKNITFDLVFSASEINA